MKIAFYTFGCKVNQYETQALRQQFAAQGWEVLEFDHQGGWDAVVVNSCTVTAEGDRKTRQLLRRLRREKGVSGNVAGKGRHRPLAGRYYGASGAGG